MTQVERKQQDRTFRAAGRKAYRMGIERDGNPYKGHHATLWEQGWNSARESDRKRR